MGDLDSDLGERCDGQEEESAEAFEQRIAEGEAERARQAEVERLAWADRFGTSEALTARANSALLQAASLTGGGACSMNPDERQDAGALQENASFFRLQARRLRKD